MKKIKSIKKKTNYTSITFVSLNKYKNLVNKNKIDGNVVYFIDDSIKDNNGDK